MMIKYSNIPACKEILMTLVKLVLNVDHTLGVLNIVLHYGKYMLMVFILRLITVVRD